MNRSHKLRRWQTFPILTLLCLAAAASADSWTDAVSSKPERPWPPVEYWRLTLAQPRPLRAHIVRIDLTDPGVSFLVTPPPKEPPEGKEIRLKRTTAFAAETGCMIAVNAAPWAPVAAEGTPADLCGLAASRGTVYSPDQARYPVFNISRDNQVRIGAADAVGEPWNAAAGFQVVLRKGDVAANGTDLHPRTGIGVDSEGKRLILAVIDGRQPGVSEGATVAELAQLMKAFGASDALNLDGGGSSTLVFQTVPGRPVIQNRPVGVQNVPGTERPVANHLGVFIRQARPEGQP